MNRPAYPRERIEAVLVSTELPRCYRIVPGRYVASLLGTAPADSRFCSKAGVYTMLYASPDFTTSFIETVVRDRFVRRRRREILLKEVTERVWASIVTQPRKKLTLLDLRQDGCALIGAQTDTVNARNHAAGRAFGKAIHSDHEDIDGLVYPSRLTGGDVYAMFDRAIGKLELSGSGLLPDHPELPDVLEKHGIGLVLDH